MPSYASFDADAVKWFRAMGHSYQARMNAVLIACMHAVKSREIAGRKDKDWKGGEIPRRCDPVAAAHAAGDDGRVRDRLAAAPRRSGRNEGGSSMPNGPLRPHRVGIRITGIHYVELDAVNAQHAEGQALLLTIARCCGGGSGA